MIPASPGAELFSFGSFTFLWYSLFALVAACVGTWVILHLARRSGISSSHMIDTVFWVLLIGLVGARIYHVWNEWWWYKDQLFEIWSIWEGGIAIHGGIVFGLGALFMISRQKKIPLIRFTDVIAPGLLLAQAIGRWGNYFNEELFGKPYDGFLALEVTLPHRPSPFVMNATFYPLFLYEFVLNGALFLFMFVYAKRTTIGSGLLTAIYLIGYGIIRFSLDFFRFEQFGFWGITLAQWVSLLMIAVGVFLLLRFRVNKSYKKSTA